MGIAKPHKEALANIILVLLILLEQGAFLYFFRNGILSHPQNALLYFTSSFAFGVCIIWKFYDTRLASNTSAKKNNVILLITTGIGMAALVAKSQSIIDAVPVDIAMSDIIPAIQIMAQRFLAGDFPYAPMTELGYTTPAGYMPMHWLPYAIAEVFHFDYRYMSFIIWAIAVLYIIKRSSTVSPTFIKMASLILILWAYLFMLQHNDGILTTTAEVLVAAYYMLMVSGLNNKNFYLQGAVIGLCCLSRYSLMFWLPLWAFVLYVSGNKKGLLQACTVIASMTLLLYVLPFLSHNWSMFTDTAKAYASMSWEWQHLCGGDKPCHFYSGLGFAYLFYEQYSPEEFLKSFALMRNFFTAITMSTVILLGVWYWFKRNKIDYRIFLMASFKIYLSIFFAFITVPYGYLMVTAGFVTVVMFMEQARYKRT